MFSVHNIGPFFSSIFSSWTRFFLWVNLEFVFVSAGVETTNGRITEWRKTESTMMFTELQMTVLLKENFRLLQPGQRYRGTSLVLNCCYASAWLYMYLLMYEEALRSKNGFRGYFQHFEIFHRIYEDKPILANRFSVIIYTCFHDYLHLWPSASFNI